MKKSKVNFPTLRRGQSNEVTNLLSSFGALKETHISGYLGYLFYVNPALARLVFGIKEPVSAVYVEMTSTARNDRYDIVLDTNVAKYVVEIKIDGHSPEQLHKYQKFSRNLFVIGRRLNSHRVRKGLMERFIDWERLAELLIESKSNGKNADSYFNRLVDDLILHLKENNMIRGPVRDVYMRDLSGDSVEWYFNKCIFFAQGKYFDYARSSRFFAPYLTKSNNTKERFSVFRSLGVGISFVSKIEDCILGTPREIRAALESRRWPKSEIDLIFKSQKWTNASRVQFTIILLSKPLRLFQRPVTKTDIWGGLGGAMPSFTIDFGDLIAASNGLQPLKKVNRRRKPKT